METTSATGRRFRRALAAVAAIGAAVRLVFVLSGSQRTLWSDGLDYHVTANRLADGMGYIGAVFFPGQPTAQHPPAWVTLLGAISWLGGRTVRAHQFVGITIGIALIVVIGLV